MRILILCDHAFRDIPGHAALQVAIESVSAHEVLVCDIHLFGQVTEIFKPHLVLMNHLFDPARNKIVDSIRRRGGLCAVLPNEGRPNTPELVEWAATKFDTRLCDLYLSWSQEFANSLTVPYVVTGCPRFDFYYDLPHRGELLSLYGLTDDRPVITVASSFPQAKFAGFAVDFLESDWKKLKMTTVPGRENPAAMAEADNLALQKFMAWMECLLAENDYQMIVKPNPAEDVQPWREFCHRTGAKLMLTDYATSLLAMSDVHVSRVGCLTAVEAWMAGKDSVQCEVGNDFVSGATKESLEWSYRVDGYGGDFGLSGAVFDALSDDAEPYNQATVEVGQRKYIEKWMGPYGNSAQLTAKAIVDLLDSKQPKLAFEFSTDDRVQLHTLLTLHSQQYAVPSSDNIGQFAKVPTFAAIQGWLEKIRNRRAHEQTG